MGITRAKMMDSAIGTNQIAADTIIPADIDETQPYNFSSTSNTIVADSVTGTKTIGTTCNFSSTNSSIAGISGANLIDATVSKTITAGMNFTSSNSSFTQANMTRANITALQSMGAGSGYFAGTFNYVGSSTVVLNSIATANSLIFFAPKAAVSNLVMYYTTTAGSFTVNTSSALPTTTVAYQMIN